MDREKLAAGGDTGQQEARPNIEEAKSAALDHTSWGRVTGTEVVDEEGYYEIEVTRDDGSRVDVHLDRGFDAPGNPPDHGGPVDG